MFHYAMLRDSALRSLAPHSEAVVALLQLLEEQSHGCLQLFLVKCATLRMRMSIDARPSGAADAAAGRVGDAPSLCVLMHDIVDSARSWDDVHAMRASFGKAHRQARDAMLVSALPSHVPGDVPGTS